MCLRGAFSSQAGPRLANPLPFRVVILIIPAVGRVIAIGDVHGCCRELEDLLNLLRLDRDDQVVFLGDLVNTGPDSHRVVEIAREIGALSLLGNHERRLLKYRADGKKSRLKKMDRRTIKQLSSEDWDYLAEMKLTFFHKPTDTVLVHAGFLPGRPWQSQPARIVTEIQVVDESGKARRRSKSRESPRWALLWEGPPFVVYGHTPDPQYFRLKWSIGIDTACVQGGKLTAFELSKQEIVQVSAREKYA